MAKLTKTAIDALAIPATGQAFLWDSDLRGFGVRVIPSGLKAFVVQYQNEEGRSRRIVIGRYGVLTVEQARKQAILKLAAVVGGADPAEERAQSRAAITIREVCNWYLENAEAGMILGKGHVLGIERFDKRVGMSDRQRLEGRGLDQSQYEAALSGTTVPAFGVAVVKDSQLDRLVGIRPMEAPVISAAVQLNHFVLDAKSLCLLFEAASLRGGCLGILR